MPTASLVSVIVPAYNAERFLADSVRSVLGQTREELELVIVNDGSTDRTGELAHSFRAADPRVRVVDKPNGGLSSARNAGIARARGELLCFLDADDVFLPDKLERQVAFLELFPSSDLVYSDHYVGDASLAPVLLDRRAPPAIPMRQLLACRNWFAPMAALLRAGLQRRIGLFDESLAASEDWDFWIRASETGILSYLPGPVGVYRTHGAQMHNDARRMREAQEKVVRKNFHPGTPAWRMAQASLAWLDAERHWGRRNRAIAFGRMCQSLWHAQSRRTFRDVMTLLRM